MVRYRTDTRNRLQDDYESLCDSRFGSWPVDVRFGASTREKAVTPARLFAARHAVNPWYRDTTGERLLEAYERRPGHGRGRARPTR